MQEINSGGNKEKTERLGPYIKPHTGPLFYLMGCTSCRLLYYINVVLPACHSNYRVVMKSDKVQLSAK
jgi:hypothetical protein